jgi:hypothetical protein
MKAFLLIGTVALLAVLTFPVVMGRVCPKHDTVAGGPVRDFLRNRVEAIRERRQQRRENGRIVARLVGRAC